MRVLGIDISGKSAIFCGIEKSGDDFLDITGSLKKLDLKNDEDCTEVREFAEIVRSYFDESHFNSVAILKRSKNGQFASSPISFKIEGLIQINSSMNVVFIAPATLTAFYKKYTLGFSAQFAYQSKAANLAFYLAAK
ncbi:DUF3010 family protein [Hymenobacter perfusus]|uniref:DUF3010 family protein n=1 Tax=Hymenobacter perfusus TaxID=1236770 RepID=A0A3R9NY39_9BACT|nr:DUF3010 family protein [Hymenobacter perfusus]RSK40140.1 DUF3010 family protein [Hymenobacter perfusus]